MVETPKEGAVGVLAIEVEAHHAKDPVVLVGRKAAGTIEDERLANYSIEGTTG